MTRMADLALSRIAKAKRKIDQYREAQEAEVEQAKAAKPWELEMAEDLARKIRPILEGHRATLERAEGPVT